jgi:hypothetical protein
MSAMTTPMQRANAWSQLVIGAAIEVHRIKGLVHRLISGRHTAVGDLADFQGASDDHT